jgi:hypothetical protein
MYCVTDEIHGLDIVCDSNLKDYIKSN